MAIDPQVASLLAEMAALGEPPITPAIGRRRRSAAEGMIAMSGDSIEVGAVDEITIPVDGAEIGARVYTPAGDGPYPVVMFFHGGGWVICGLDTHDNIAHAICRDADALVVSVDYRMAPEYRFPTAAHDCFAATKWVADNAASMGGDPTGWPCAATVPAATSAPWSRRWPGTPAARQMSYAALIYPAVDMTRKGGSLDENATGYFLETEGMEWFIEPLPRRVGACRCAGVTTVAREPRRSAPLLHCHVRVRPSARRRRGIRRRASCQTEVHVDSKRYDGLIHGAANMTGVLDAGRQLVADTAAAPPRRVAHLTTTRGVGQGRSVRW